MERDELDDLIDEVERKFFPTKNNPPKTSEEEIQKPKEKPLSKSKSVLRKSIS